MLNSVIKLQKQCLLLYSIGKGWIKEKGHRFHYLMESGKILDDVWDDR